MLKISSKQNAQLKQWRKLLTSKGRKQTRQYIIEGIHLIEEAIASKVKIRYVIVSESFYKKHSIVFSDEVSDIVLIADNCVSELSQTEKSQGIFAIVDMEKPVRLSDDFKRVLLIDAVQDPGNLGTIIRTADAAGFDAVVLGEGTVDLYNDKVIRSTQGSLWHLPIIQENLAKTIEIMKQQKWSILATALNDRAKPYHQIKEWDKLAIIVGNEGNGVRENFISLSDEQIFIPMPGKAESLNVAVASGILMFHFI